MIQLVKFSSKDVIPEGDYVLDKPDQIFDILKFLTPKFEDHWVFILIDPKIKFVKDLIREGVPEWVDVKALLSQKKVNEVVQDFPQYAPRELTTKEIVEDIISKMNHVIDVSARKLVVKAVGKNPKELASVFAQLDAECEGNAITLKQAQSVVVYQKRTYASDVIRNFLLKRPERWKTLTELIHELGDEYAYYSLRSFVRKLLADKNAYLNNEDYTIRLVEEVDAPFICYVYSLFAKSTNYEQLIGIMSDIDRRSDRALERNIIC